MRMYHPNLEPPHNECEVPDDEACIAVHAESGWLRAPEPEARPGYEPEPVTYAPVVNDPPDEKPRGKAAKAKPTDA